MGLGNAVLYYDQGDQIQTDTLNWLHGVHIQGVDYSCSRREYVLSVTLNSIQIIFFSYMGYD